MMRGRFVALVLYCFSSVSARIDMPTLSDQTGWPESTEVTPWCMEGPFRNVCHMNCETMGANVTLATLQRECMPHLPMGYTMRLDRRDTYSTLSGPAEASNFLTLSPFTSYTGYMWGVSFEGHEVDTNMDPRLLKRAVLNFERFFYEYTGYSTQIQSPPTSDIKIYNATISGFISDKGDRNGGEHAGFNTEDRVFAQNFDVDAPMYITHWITLPGFEFMNSVTLDITEFVRGFMERREKFPTGLLIVQEEMNRGHAWYIATNYAQTKTITLKMETEAFVVGAQWCQQFYNNCEDCLAAKGCDWCLLPSGLYTCSDKCSSLWVDNECDPRFADMRQRPFII